MANYIYVLNFILMYKRKNLILCQVLFKVYYSIKQQQVPGFFVVTAVKFLGACFFTPPS